MKKDFEALPKGAAVAASALRPAAISGMQVTIIEKNAPATAISFGFPIEVKRGDDDFYAYIDHFPGGHSRQFPPANVARRQQIFQVMIWKRFPWYVRGAGAQCASSR